jgi:hypothetical protein
MAGEHLPVRILLFPTKMTPPTPTSAFPGQYLALSLDSSFEMARIRGRRPRKVHRTNLWPTPELRDQDRMNIYFLYVVINGVWTMWVSIPIFKRSIPHDRYIKISMAKLFEMIHTHLSPVVGQNLTLSAFLIKMAPPLSAISLPPSK